MEDMSVMGVSEGLPAFVGQCKCLMLYADETTLSLGPWRDARRAQSISPLAHPPTHTHTPHPTHPEAKGTHSKSPLILNLTSRHAN